MEDVTDNCFRIMLAGHYRPDVFFTEFTNVEGLISAGRGKIIKRLEFEKTQRPIVAQIWGIKPDNYYRAGREIVAMGFDGIDINMGCPVRAVVRKGGGGGMIARPELAKEVILATLEGAGGKIPVSVKTRIGYREIETENWLSKIINLGVAAITVHGRTVAQGGGGTANWEEISRVVNLRDVKAPEVIIIGNGDVESWEEAKKKRRRYGVDGVMIGRGIFKDFYIFSKGKKVFGQLSLKEKAAILSQHLKLYRQNDGNDNYNRLKKYFKIYLAGSEEAGRLRLDLMATKSIEEALRRLGL